MAKADIELLFGVAGGGSVGGASGAQIKSDLEGIINGINGSPLEIKLKVDSTNFKKDLADLTAYAQAEAAKIQAAYNINLPSVNGGGNGGNKNGGSKNSNRIIAQNTAEMYNALAQLQEQELKLRKMVNEWTAAKDGQAKYAIKRAEDELTNINAYKQGLQSGTTTATQFAKQLKEVRAVARQVAAESKLFGEDRALIDFTKGSEAHNKALADTNKLLISTKKNYDSWTAAKKGATESDYAGLGDELENLRQMHDSLENGSMTFDEYQSKLSQSKANIDKYSSGIKAAGKDTKSFGDKVNDLISKFSRWLSVSQIVMKTIQTFKQMVVSVKEIDTAMTELRKVTDETEATYDRFLTNAASRAKSLGATLTDTVAATADFAKLGKSIEEASELADAAIVYKNVGDNIESISQAAESIISTMQAFSGEKLEAMEIVDKYNSIGNAFAITSTGVGEALQRSAAAMQAAGNSLDETIALVTAANTIVQNPESVGTTLKTVSMYLRAAKTEAEEAGESTDGMASSVSELRDELLMLTGNRVDIQISENQFKSTYEILRELSEVWGELTDVSQANILEMVGGKRNANVLSSLLQNFEIAEKALNVSAGSAGSALAENEKYLDSIQGKINKFNASWQALSAAFIDSAVVKAVIDFGTIFVDAITYIAESLGGLGAALVALPIGIFASKIDIIADTFDVIKSAASATVGGGFRFPC